MAGFPFLARTIVQYTKLPQSPQALVHYLQVKGLTVPDPAAAAATMTMVSYFRLKGYALEFMQNAPNGFPHGSRVFVPGTTFEQIMERYELDRSLRMLILEQIDRIEVAIRTVIVQELSTHFASAHWHLNFSAKVLNTAEEQAKLLTKTSQEVHRSKETFIKHYFNKYSSPILPPAWAAAECMSLGFWSQLYKNLAVCKGAIASTFGLTPPVLQSWLHSLSVIRNTCAHHGMVWGRRSWSFPPSVHPLYSGHFGGNKLYPFLAAVRILTTKIDKNPYFRDGLVLLFRNNPSANPSKLGFPANWENDPLWQ